MSTIFTIGIFLSLFLAVLLFTKKHRILSDTILGICLTSISIYLLNYYLNYLGYWHKYPHLVGATHPFPLLYAPFIYLYFFVNLRKEQRFKWKDILHFLPFILTYVSMFPFLFGYSAAEKAMLDEEGFNSPFRYFFMFSFIEYLIVSAVYLVLTYIKIYHYQRVIKNNFGYNEGISLWWLLMLLDGFVIIYGAISIIYVVQFELDINLGFKAELIPYALFVVFVAFIGFFGIRYQGIFTAEKTKNIELVEPQEENKYQKSGLKDAEAETLHQQMCSLMEKEKPYLEPKLSLGQLAEMLGVAANKLSQVINQYEEKNFYDFVNGYRVQEFIVRAQNDKNKNLNLLGIAYGSGFNSKSSFNQVFKKFMGETPTSYLRKGA